jgi:hypothetical protein
LDLTPGVPAAPLVPLKFARNAMIVHTELAGLDPDATLSPASGGTQLPAAFEAGVLVMTWHVNVPRLLSSLPSTAVHLTIRLTNRSSTIRFLDLALRIPKLSCSTKSVDAKSADWTVKALLSDPMVAFDSRVLEPGQTITARVAYMVPTTRPRTAWKLADSVEIVQLGSVEEVLESWVEGGVTVWI